MELTQIKQRCYSTEAGEDIDYVLELSVEEKGELPKEAIFVYSITDSDAPDSDTFLSICDVQQLQDLSVGRWGAIAKGDTEYLSTFVQFRYTDDIETAVAAKEALFSRINDLINTWITFSDDFAVDDNTDKYFPTADPGYEEQLKDAYKDAKDTTAVAQTAYDEAQAEYDVAVVALDHAKEIRDIYEKCKTNCTDVALPAGNSYQAYANLVISDTLNYPENPDATTYRTGPNGPADTLVNLTAICSEIDANYAAASSDVSAAESALADANTAKIEAASTLNAARKAEDEALANVLDVCPSFDPNSV